jgi:uncharacterized protein (DUF305 family)
VISLATSVTMGATSLALAHGPTSPHRTHAPSAPIQLVADRPDDSSEAPFLAENAAAMDKMMADMAVKPTGEVDRDFVAMMVPHHQGAIDMAQAELRYGHNEQLRRIAQEIIVEQQQEIVAMRVALGQPLPPAAPAPDQPSAARPASSAAPSMSGHGMNGMHMNMNPPKESQ